MSNENKTPNLPNIPTEYHGNIAPNVHNLESKELKQHLVQNNKNAAQHYREAGVSLSDFKPTQNVWRGNEKDLDPVLTSGDLGRDKFFTEAFERQQKGEWLGEGEPEDRTLHGNKGKNLGNLESTELKDTLLNKHKEAAQHFKEANVKLSDFKPTQNIQKGHEKELDPVLVKGDLGKDKFFTSAFERQAKEAGLGLDGNDLALHGNKGLNISNIESTDLKDKLLHKHEEMADNFKKANVTLSDFKPTQNVQKGHEKDLDPVLIAGDLGKDKFFTSAFERQQKGENLEGDDKWLHGNKGTNLGNLESQEMKQHVIDNNKKMADNYNQANVSLSDFKPTQNVQKGHEKELDPVLVAGDLGKDQFFTRAFENQAKIDESNLQHPYGHGNKGTNTSNLSSTEYIDHMIHNMQKSDQNVKNSHIQGDTFKPNHDKFVGRNMAKEPSNEEAFKGQALDEVLEDKSKETPTA